MTAQYCKYCLPTMSFIVRFASLLREDNKVLAGIDTNGHSSRWHCKDNNRRGRLFEEVIDDFNLEIMNKSGSLNTYARPNMGTSNIDVTLANSDIARRITGWCVLDITDSDHRVLGFDYNVPGRVAHKKQPSGRLCERRADWARYNASLAVEMAKLDMANMDVNGFARALTKAIQVAAGESIPRTRAKRNTRKPPWWNSEIAISKSELSKGRSRKDVSPDTYRRKRNAHVGKIRCAKMASWRDFCGSAREDVGAKPIDGPRARGRL